MFTSPFTSPFTSKTIPQLRLLCKERKIKGYSGLNKKQLIELLMSNCKPKKLVIDICFVLGLGGRTIETRYTTRLRENLLKELDRKNILIHKYVTEDIFIIQENKTLSVHLNYLNRITIYNDPQQLLNIQAMDWADKIEYILTHFFKYDYFLIIRLDNAFLYSHEECLRLITHKPQTKMIKFINHNTILFEPNKLICKNLNI